MPAGAQLRAAVVGIGFVGVVHVEALRRLGLGDVAEPDFPSFRDGHRANVLGDAIARSNAERRWVEVP